MRHETYIDVLKSVFLTVACLIFFPLLLPAISPSHDLEVSDSIEAAADDSVPTWYQEPVIPDSLKAPFGAPLRAAAASCMTDSILTFNVDSVLTEATTYDYDAAGRTIRTTVWQYAADGSRTGKSKQEYAFDASGTQIYTGTFAWDAATNDWKGTSKSEYVYNEAHKMESNITYTWVNNTWLPSQALTYAYDAAGRETEFTTYARNASLNRLVPSKQRLQTWYNSSKKTLEINYTAYTNGAWSAGTRKDYQYDAKGNQIEYTYYASYSGGNWVGSTHEIWTYNASNKKTYYKKEMWSSNAWAVSNEEFTGYDAAGNTILVENYALKSGVLSGSQKEEYTFNTAKKKTSTITYKWTNGEWVYNVWSVSGYDAAGNANETCKYNWKNDTWVGTGNRVLKTYNSSKKVTEQITQNWPSVATDWVNVSRTTTEYSGSNTTREISFTWSNDVWVGNSRKDYHYNAAGQNDTIMTYANNGTDWLYFARTVNTYNSRGENILTHNASWDGSAWIMTSMNRLDVAYNTAGSTTLSASYTCGSDSVWIGGAKSEYVYNENNQRILTYRYRWSNNDWIYNERALADYDSNNRMIFEERCLYNNNTWVGDYKNKFAYDINGRQILIEKYGWSNGAWIGSYKYVYVYDNAGNTLENWTYNWKDTTWIPSLSHICTYDAQNHKIEDIVSRRSTTTGFSPEIKYVYAYGTNNVLILQNDYSWADGVWLLRSQNEKTYDSADNKLRRELVASYRGGVCQSYKDSHYFYSCDAPTVNNGSQPRTPTELEEIDENNGNYENDDTNVQPFDPMLPTYNLQGQSVDPATYHGIVIQNGKKYVL